MARRILFRFRMTLLVVSVIALSVAFGTLRDAAPRVTAASPEARADRHPYDADWPVVYPLLMEKCSGCHRPGTDRTDLTSYDAIVKAVTEDDEQVVQPGRPDDSVLWNYVAWNVEAKRNCAYPASPMMPEKKSEWLTAGQLKTIHRWITNGALQYRLPTTCSIRPLMEMDYPSAKQCRACHPRQYEQWSRSMHHYAQKSPTFVAFNQTLQERTSGTLGTFCTRCHTPLGTNLGENGLMHNIHRSRISMEGVTCIVCHRMKGKYYKSSGNIATQPGAMLDTCVFGPFADSASEAMQSHPGKGQSFMKSSAFCSACHDVFSPSGVRLEEAFSEWQNSPAAKRGQTCQSCHMGPVAGVPIADCDRPMGRAAVIPGVDPSRLPLRHLTDHTFAGPDYSLLPDTEFPETLDWMAEVDYRDAANLTPYQQKTLDDLRRKNRKQLKLANAKRYELLRNAAHITVRSPQHARSGEKVSLRVDVTSTTAGHSFPTGFTAERQLWVEVVVRDPAGCVVFASGTLDTNGDLRDEHSHAVETRKIPHDRFLLNFQNKFMARTAVGTERSVILPINRHGQPVNILRPATGIPASFGQPETFRLARGALPPLATIGRNYPIRLPNRPGDYCVDVRLNFRHLPPTLLDHIGTPHLKRLLEIVVIDQHQSTIRVRENP